MSQVAHPPRNTMPADSPVAPRILVVDDEPYMCDVCSRTLQRAGYEVVATSDPHGAARLLQGPQHFDLLLTDIKMPVMDGIALALATARDYPDVTILLMTGYADQRERAHGLEALIHDVIVKPLSVEGIRAAVDKALAGERV